MTQSYRAFVVLFVLSLFVSSNAITVFAQTGDIDPNGAAPQVCINLSTNLRYRDTDSTTNGAITSLQNFLIGEGYMQGEATGRFGAITFASVQKYQTAKGFTSSGYVGPLTRAAIHADSCFSDSASTGGAQQTATANQTTTSTAKNTMQTTASSNTVPTPTRPASGSISGDSRECTVVLGASTCPIIVRWSSLNYAASPYLSACQTSNRSSCGTSEMKYVGANGSHLFNLGAGTSWLFALWGIDYLGQLVKTDQLVLRGKCAVGSILNANGTACVSSSSNNTIQSSADSGNINDQNVNTQTTTADICASYDASQFCTTDTCTTNTGVVRHGTKDCSTSASSSASAPAPAPIDVCAAFDASLYCPTDTCTTNAGVVRHGTKVCSTSASASAPAPAPIDVCAAFDASLYCPTDTCTTNAGVVRHGTKNCDPVGGSGYTGYNYYNGSGDSSGSGGVGGSSGGSGAGGSGGSVGGNNGDDGGAVGSGVSI